MADEIYVTGEFVKRKVADEMVGCDTHFENDQLVAVLDILDKIGVPAMYDKLVKVCKWLDMLALDADKQAKSAGNFITLKEACEHDAKNFRATANDIRVVLAKIEGK